MMSGADAPLLIVTCPSHQILTLTMRVPRPPGSPGTRRLVSIKFHQLKGQVLLSKCYYYRSTLFIV
jgi:hypothetical protein